MKISVIVTTYNRPRALEIVLHSLFQQQRLPDEILVADDGSTPATEALLTALQARSPCPLRHVWQADDGFRAAGIRNQAVAQATGDYLIFLDGDSVVLANFVAQHERLAEKGWLVAGNRLLLSEVLTADWEAGRCNPLHFSALAWLGQRLAGKVNRLLPLIRCPTTASWRKKKPAAWAGAKTCNLAVWRQDFVAVNGFDELFHGWGHEDADLAIRLIHQGVSRKEGRFAVPILHLWHRESPRDFESANLQRLQSRLADKTFIRAIKGME